MTQVELFYESNLVVGRSSFPVHAKLGVEPALRLLLKGTGLSIASFSRDTITILPQTEPDPVELVQIKAKTMQFYPYFAVLQESLGSVFCKTPLAHTNTVELLASRQEKCCARNYCHPRDRTSAIVPVRRR